MTQRAAAGRLPDKAEARQPARVVVEGTNCVCPTGVCPNVCSRDSEVFSKLSPKRQTEHLSEKDSDITF